MAPTPTSAARPRALQTAKSFSRFEPAHSPLTSNRSRASTIQTPAHPKADGDTSLGAANGRRHNSDVFERRVLEEEGDSSPEIERPHSLPERFDELPIELASLTDRFIESLTTKSFTEPPNIEDISDLFQEFYAKASSHISTHIAALASRLNRESSPTTKSLKTASGNKAGAIRSNASRDSLRSLEKEPSDQQMLTASEVTQRRKARRLLDLKQTALEEAVERRACEKIYDRIWRHKSTIDEVRDEKLRSKQAALSLVGIGLKDLGIEVGEHAENGEATIREWLAPAREGLAQMDEEKCPLGKLWHLEAAHKSIVETLSKFHSSSSSADEILPTLIFTLITCPPEGINIISNLYFIQRFRSSSKIDGEAAYCMTNLEAAISFLENVDLSTLREDELPEGPAKSSSRPQTPHVEKPEEIPTLNIPPSMPSISSGPTAALSDSTAAPTFSDMDGPASSLESSTRPRRISNPFQKPLNAIGAANDAVRNTAEEVSKNISDSLDNSFKFLFGRLKAHSQEGLSPEVVLPKTLDDARLLVSPPPAEDALGTLSESSSVADVAVESPDLKTATRPEDKLLGMIGGRQAPSIRDRSVDSTQSSGSGRRVAFAQSNSSNLASTPNSTAVVNPFDSVKNLGTSLNPLTHLSALGGGLRSFGAKQQPTPAAATVLPSETDSRRPPPIPTSSTKSSSASVTGVGSVEISDTTSIRFDPPLRKFLMMQNAGDLKVSDIAELLEDYQRISGVLLKVKKEGEK